ncbi:hypothetical protein GY45DRAFT_1323043 [Cubamyces sp. BRFM 1775]|nr:hypothetical protein GY45DRAFT_1323043 [Cubamyces sp. BRFM 1775]
MAAQIKRSFQDNRDALSSARKALEDQIASHIDAIVGLKGRLNNMAPAFCLPPEILSEIFTFVAIDAYESRQRPQHPRIQSYQWLSVTYVCRAWREIALNTPRLWSHIVLTSSKIVPEIISRSKKAPLWITGSVDHEGDPRLAMLDRLVEDPMRIKELRLNAPERLIQIMSAKWATPAKALESIMLSSDHGCFEHAALFPIKPLSNFFSGETPNLRRLEIKRVSLHWNNPLFCSSLRTLVVHSRYDPTPRLGELPQLLDALETMQSLETLYLNEAIPRLPDSATHIPEPQRTVALPKLRSITLLSDALECANMLAHLSLPNNVQLSVTGRMERGVEDLVKTLNNQLARSDPLRTGLLAPVFSSQIQVKAWRVPLEGDLAQMPEADLELHLDAIPHARTLDTLINESTFFSKLHHLQVQCIFRNWDWKMLFERTPELRTMGIICQPSEGFLPALSTVSAEDAESGQPGVLPLPHLHTLELTGVRFGCPHSDHESQFLVDLIDWLVLRCNYGAPILTLDITDCINIGEEDVDRLRQVVAEVEWDGEENYETNIALPAWQGDFNMDAYMDDMFSDHEDLYDDDDDFASDDLEYWMIPFGG